MTKYYRLHIGPKRNDPLFIRAAAIRVSGLQGPGSGQQICKASCFSHWQKCSQPVVHHLVITLPFSPSNAQQQGSHALKRYHESIMNKYHRPLSWNFAIACKRGQYVTYFGF
jgi:hypothetical protein